jgi:hypothetical protein
LFPPHLVHQSEKDGRREEVEAQIYQFLPSRVINNFLDEPLRYIYLTDLLVRKKNIMASKKMFNLLSATHILLLIRDRHLGVFSRLIWNNEIEN